MQHSHSDRKMHRRYSTLQWWIDGQPQASIKAMCRLWGNRLHELGQVTKQMTYQVFPGLFCVVLRL